MSAREQQTRARGTGRLLAIVLGVAALVFAAANAHLVYVAITTQPDCVARSGATEDGGYRAARPAC